MRDRENAKPSPTASAAVADYLRRHPDFLADHPDLLDVLIPPAQRRGDGVVDMQRYMVERLQIELARHKTQQAELIAASRANLATQNRIHAAVVSLLGATTLEHLIEIITTDFAIHLEVDAVALVFEALDRIGPNSTSRFLKLVPKGRIDRLMVGGRDIMLLADAPGDEEVFGGMASLVRSQALLRLNLRREAPTGMIAFGARAPDRFHPGQGTELLAFLGRTVELTLRGWLDRF